MYKEPEYCILYWLIVCITIQTAGMSREGSVGYDDAVWSDGTPTRTMIGRWSPGQPDDTSGSCTTALADSTQQYPWSLHSCHQRLPFVCELKACLPGKN